MRFSISVAKLQPGVAFLRFNFYFFFKQCINLTGDGTVNKKLLKQWIDNSYQLIVNSLPKKLREEMNKK